jgi:uncharacterized membrane protein HdeD (DUF308 family)
MFGSMNLKQTMIFLLAMIIVGAVCTAVYLFTKILLFLVFGIYFLAVGIPVYLITYFVYREFGDRN